MTFDKGRISTPLSTAPKNLVFPKDSVHVVTWHGAFQRNLRAKSLPLVYVHFRRVLSNGALGPRVSMPTGVTALGQLRIGSIWEGQTSVSQFALEEREFDLDFSQRGWRSISSARHHAEVGQALVPPNRYELPYGERDRSEILIFDAGADGELLVPSSEFFARCYGRSAHVNRVLCTYPWEEAAPRLFLTASERIPGDWVVRLHPSVYKEDALLVAHAQHDPAVRHRLKQIYAQLAAAHDDSRPLLFPVIGPWFGGTATLRVEGVQLSPDRFLALRILGGTEPDGPRVHPEFGQPSEVEDQQDDPDVHKYMPRPIPLVMPAQEPERRKLNHDVAPDGVSSGLEFTDPSYTVLRPRRRVHALRVDRDEGERSRRRVGPPPEQVSAADADGGGSTKGVGRAGVRSPIHLESEGATRDIWNALQWLKRAHPEIILAVHWFTFADGYVDQGEPVVQALPDLDASQELLEASSPVQLGDQLHGGAAAATGDPDSRPKASPSWLYLDPKERTRPRCVLICRVTAAEDRVAYLFEVERRRRGGSAQSDDAEEKEESFRGLVIAPSTDEPAASWLLRLLQGIRDEEGKMLRAIRFCPPGQRDVYRRSSSAGDQVAGHSTTVTALDKVGIKVPRPQRPVESEVPDA